MGNQILHHRSGIISIRVHPSAFVQVSSSSRDRKRPAGQVCVGEASPNWPNTSETAVNGRCQQEMWHIRRDPIPQRARADDELTLPRLLGSGTVNRAVLPDWGGFPAVLNFDCAGNIIGLAGGQNLDWFLVSLAVFKHIIGIG